MGLRTRRAGSLATPLALRSHQEGLKKAKQIVGTRGIVTRRLKLHPLAPFVGVLVRSPDREFHARAIFKNERFSKVGPLKKVHVSMVFFGDVRRVKIVSGHTDSTPGR
jgi:hypothetical protein